MIIISLLLLFQTHKYLTSPSPSPSTKPLSWENFISDCGRKVYLQNEVHAKHLFQQNYFQKQVDYTGVFMKLEVHYDGVGHVDHYHLLIKMIPTDSNEGDVMLIFSQAKYKQLQNKIKVLKFFSRNSKSVMRFSIKGNLILWGMSLSCIRFYFMILKSQIILFNYKIFKNSNPKRHSDKIKKKIYKNEINI